MDNFINTIRKKVVDLTGIDAENDLQIEGEDFDNSDKTEWVSEFVSGGDFFQFSNYRTNASGYIVEYDFFTKSGFSISESSKKADMCAEYFAGSSFDTEHYTIHVERVKVKNTVESKCNRSSLILTLFIQKR